MEYGQKHKKFEQRNLLDNPKTPWILTPRGSVLASLCVRVLVTTVAAQVGTSASILTETTCFIRFEYGNRVGSVLLIYNH
jgi:hypothetical protein